MKILIADGLTDSRHAPRDTVFGCKVEPMLWFFLNKKRYLL